MPVNLASTRQGFTSNAFLVSGDRNVLVDPGNEFDVVGQLRERIDRLDGVVLTHTHPDHVGNVDAVVDAFDVDVWGYDADHPLVDRELEDGDPVRMGDHEYAALYTPGHAADHLCFYASEPRVLFAGDLVFANGSFGRTDLEAGDRSTLLDSIGYVLDTVGENLAEMHAGHGPSVTTDPYEHIVRARLAAGG